MEILITGITGFLGKHLKENLILKGHNVSGLSRSNKQIINCHIYSMDELDEGLLNISPDIIIHGAFSRKSEGTELAKSLQYTKKLLEFAHEKNVKGFINISSQSVYGNLVNDRDENSEIDPNYLYAFAKYASELLVESHRHQMAFTNIRLAGLTGGKEPKTDGVIPYFVKSTINNNDLILKNSQNLLSIIDVRDAAEGIAKIIDLKPTEWDKVYNLGNNWQITIEDLAKNIIEKAGKYGFNKSSIIKYDNNKIIDARLNNNLLMEKTGWEPEFDIDKIVLNFFDYFLEEKND